MSETTVLTDKQIEQIELHIDLLHEARDFRQLFPRAIEQAVLQSPEVQRLRSIERAALDVLLNTEGKHRPPVREAIPCGTTARVSLHYLANLHDALHPDSRAKAEPLEQKP